jgi:hypothetical protein
MYLADSSSAFLTPPPRWSLEGAILECADGVGVTLQQSPFRWVDGVWEAETTIMRGDAQHLPSHRILLRISPDTLRRWQLVAIDPFLEACAQLKDHLRRTRNGHLSALTLL